MADPIDNLESSVNSCSYDPALVSTDDSAPVSSLPVSSPQASVSSPAPLDAYSQAEPISLKTLVEVRNPASFGGRNRLTFRELLLEAPHSSAAQDEVIALVQSQAESAHVNSQCFVSSEANLTDIMSQLMASDPVTRREGRLGLEQFILHSGLDSREGTQLRLGVLATVARIRQTHPENKEAEQVVVNVYNQTPHDSPLGQGIDRLPNRSAILQIVGQSNAAQRADSQVIANQQGGGPSVGPIGIGGGVSSKELSFALDSSGTPAVLTPMSSTFNFTAAQWDKVAGLIESTVRGTSLEGIPADEILVAAQTHLAPAIEQFKQSFRLGILGLGLRYTDMPGSQFPAYANVATRLADRVASEIFSPSATELRLESDRAVDRSEAKPLVAAKDPQDPRLSPVATPQGIPSAIVPLATPLNNGSASPVAVPLTTQIAGMQGASTQGLAYAGPGVMGFNGGFSGRPSYYVEGSSADEGAHDGFSGGSHGSSSGNQGNPDGQEQKQGQPDSYIA